ncbi:Copper chaperone domain-containing protein [Dioscorea alata]|uniref:Copper chaperone domain-containing protein n=1 Tax=Dioscorea alata TaxID=55571 RepID=A0ACB7UJK0_DIOAL|nr:Copper chaperone domain-containing protein [Dioscorea alata]
MSVKFSTLILKVDLSCCQCNRKIKKLLCKIQDRENIRLIAYDDTNNTVTISGPFDPHYLKRKLYCKACKIIKDIQIPPPPPPDPPPPAKKPDPPPPAKKPDPPPEKKPDPPPEKKPDPPPQKKPDPPPEKKPDPPPEKKPDPPKSVCPPGPVCCNQPCYVGMFGGLKCASCGMVYTWTNQGPPPVMVCNQPPVPRPYYYDGYAYGYGHGCSCGCGQPKTCHFICEDNTSQCTIM